jgi:hypothetical protein
MKPHDYEPAAEPRKRGNGQVKPPKFPLTPFEEIKIGLAQEWCVKKLLPRRGVAAFYGASGSAKTFLLLDACLHVALGLPWAGRRVQQAPVVYIAAEGAGGIPKRIEGWRKTHKEELHECGEKVPFHLVTVAPNLGTGDADLKELIASIEATGVRPGLIAIDTLSQSLGSGDENNSGMVLFVSNVTALASHFDCLVAVVHHVGLSDDKRLRGHTSFIGALDAAILCERSEGAFVATLTVKKLKDEDDGLKLTTHLARVVIALDEDMAEISTLVIESVKTGVAEETKAPKQKRRVPPAALALFVEVLSQTIEQSGETIRPFHDGPLLTAAPIDFVRNRYFIRCPAKEGEGKERLADRRRKSFERAVEKAIEQTLVLSHEQKGISYLWFSGK